MKLDYKKAFTIGFGLFAAQLMWMIYNTYMPIFLQAGSPTFDANLSASTRGFGLTATMTGLIMTIDNIAAFFIQPIMGPISDRTHTRWGRRMPYILLFAPIAVIAFALIPLAPEMIPVDLNGQFDQLSGPFTFLLATSLVMLVAMALWRTPLFALMPDLIPSPLRSQANGVINLMAGVGGILAFIVGGFLYNLYRPLPFWFGGVLTLAAVGVLFWKIKEPKQLVEAAEVEGGIQIFKQLKSIPKENARSLFLLIMTIFFYMLGFNSVETFFSSYAVSTLGVSESTAAFILSASFISFIIFAIPSGMLAARIGRKKTMMIGLVIFAAALLAAFFLPIVPVIVGILVVGGIAWAAININGLPMVLDTSTSEDLMGTYSGLYFVAATLAATLGPILNGWIIDLTGQNYNMIFIVCPVFFICALFTLAGVTRGESKTEVVASDG